LLVRGSSCLDVKFEALNNDEAKVSNDFNQHRNWGLHIPESLYTNKRKILGITGAEIEKHKETIPLEVYDYFDMKYLTSFKSELDEVVSSVEALEKRMMQDYLKLTGVNFQVSFIHLKVKSYKIMDVVEASFNTQTKKNNHTS